MWIFPYGFGVIEGFFPPRMEAFLGVVEEKGIPPLVLKPRLGPPLEEDIYMVIMTYHMGVGILGIPMEGMEDTTNIPQMETHEEMGKKCVGLMELRDEKVDITRMTHVMTFRWY
jgi:hypothetical protein